MADTINIKRKRLYRSLRENGVSKKKADRVLADIAGQTKKRRVRMHRPKPVAAVKGRVKKLRAHN